MISNPKSDHPLNVHVKCILAKDVSFLCLQHEDSNLSQRDTNLKICEDCKRVCVGFIIKNIVSDSFMIKTIHASSTYAREESIGLRKFRKSCPRANDTNVSSVAKVIEYFKKYKCNIY